MLSRKLLLEELTSARGILSHWIQKLNAEKDTKKAADGLSPKEAPNDSGNMLSELQLAALKIQGVLATNEDDT